MTFIDLIYSLCKQINWIWSHTSFYYLRQVRMRRFFFPVINLSFSLWTFPNFNWVWGAWVFEEDRKYDSHKEYLMEKKYWPCVKQPLKEIQAWLLVQMNRWRKQLQWRNANFTKITDLYPPEPSNYTEEKQNNKEPLGKTTTYRKANFTAIKLVLLTYLTLP